MESGGVWWVSDERNGKWDGDDIGVRGTWTVEEWWDVDCGRMGGCGIWEMMVVGWSQ
jgi:hypothetical protein